MSEHKTNPLSIPAAIIIAGGLIGLGIFFGSKNISLPNAAVTAPAPQIADARSTESLDKMRPVTKDDHIRGILNAPVKIVEYSDTECPFCKRFHLTMKQVMDEYGANGKVAWVYRHFPLDQLHSKARKESVALECAAEQGGNDKFWAYADRLYEITPANDGLDLAELPKIAKFVGLDTTKFNECLSSGKYDKHIEDDVQNAVATGGRGTPWSIVVGAQGKVYPLSGAQPYAAIKQLIEQALQSK
ncbi:MAG: thioredoxin domain-containing protein [bacterium]|nr:thioredoxin domain-containing protein [bacterium]